jgi:hypothetical protein
VVENDELHVLGPAPLTHTTNELWPTLPAASVAEQVTVVRPTAKAEPDGGLQVACRVVDTASVTSGRVYVTIAPAIVVCDTHAGSGTVATTGAVLSLTCTQRHAPQQTQPQVEEKNEGTNHQVKSNRLRRIP